MIEYLHFFLLKETFYNFVLRNRKVIRSSILTATVLTGFFPAKQIQFFKRKLTFTVFFIHI